MLLIPPMLAHEVSYYSTLFIFLSGRMVDLLALPGDNDFRVWQTINRWGSIIACAVSFCLLIPDFADLLVCCVDLVNGLLFLFPMSCVLLEMISAVLDDDRERSFKEFVKESISHN